MSADDLLPPNATPFEKASSAADKRVLAADTDAIRRARDPAAAPSAIVPFLAWERAVHFYDPDDAAGNRARITSSFADHGQYGSPPALEQEIALDTGLTVEVREFWELADLTWPDFVVDVVVNPGDATPDLSAVRPSALKRKNVRDMLARVRILVRQPPATVYVGAATSAHVNATILPLGGAPADPQIIVAATSRMLSFATILPWGSV